MHDTKKTILVADDNPGVLDATKLLLEEMGYAVETISDGQAIKNMSGAYPDLILLDIWMSGIDGREICRHIKGHNATQDIPVIMFSANRDIEKIAKEARADDHIAKPFEMDDLLEKIERALNKARV